MPPRTYYLDCAQGSDTADGLTPDSAWRSFRRLSGREFLPGETILLRRGTTCRGMLAPKGSGSAGAPILLGAWGEGSKPKIEASPGDEAAFKLWNQEFWTIENLDFSGGNPHGVFISGDRGVLHRIHIRDSHVHGVTGEIRNKEGGLLVIAPGSAGQRFDDILVDGVTAHHTSQWAGILVGGVVFGFLPEQDRSTNVVVRNSIVHDVQGDGIVLFQVNRGVIENSVAWRTGLQEMLTIGTPDAIWTWMCRDCVVRRNEAFLADSPEIDGGAFDIDYGSDNTIVEENYGHDTQGYCVAVFGAGWVTSNSVVRNNVCEFNGLRASLARRQGAIFLSTWNHGMLNGVEITGNHVEWAPPVAAPAVVNNAKFRGKGSFRNNTIRSSSAIMIKSNGSLLFDANHYVFHGVGEPKWTYARKRYAEFEVYRRRTGQDADSRMERVSLHESRGSEDSERTSLPEEKWKRLADWAGREGWVLLAFLSPSDRDGESRSQVVNLVSMQAQYAGRGLRAAISTGETEAPSSVMGDWRAAGLTVVPGLIPLDVGCTRIPSVALIDSRGRVAKKWDGVPLPGELGPALRALLGGPDYTRLGRDSGQ